MRSSPQLCSWPVVWLKASGPLWAFGSLHTEGLPLTLNLSMAGAWQQAGACSRVSPHFQAVPGLFLGGPAPQAWPNEVMSQVSE